MNLHHAVAQRIRQADPAQVIALLHDSPAGTDPLREALSGLDTDVLPLAEAPVAFDQRHDLALVSASWLAAHDPATITATLARLRDLLADSVLAVSDDDAPLTREDWVALAYRPLARWDTHQLWGFDLHDYKARPDWLNSRFWANPENFDQYRW